MGNGQVKILLDFSYREYHQAVCWAVRQDSKIYGGKIIKWLYDKIYLQKDESLESVSVCCCRQMPLCRKRYTSAVSIRGGGIFLEYHQAVFPRCRNRPFRSTSTK